MLRELSFHNELNIAKTSKVFKGYPRSYDFENIYSKDRSVQLTITKLSIIDFLKDIFAETKG